MLAMVEDFGRMGCECGGLRGVAGGDVVQARKNVHTKPESNILLVGGIVYPLALGNDTLDNDG